MGDIVYNVLSFIVAIGVLITFHEYGHFWVAKKLGVTVLKFSVGFGPTIYKFPAKKSATEYVIAAIPLGGYVRMLDESRDDVSDDLLHTAFNRQPLYKRSAIVAAGPLANFLLAGLLYVLVYSIGNTGLIPNVGAVAENELADRAGFAVGDEVRAVNGRVNKSWDDHHFFLLNQIVSGNDVEFTLSNDGVERNVHIDFSELEDIDLSTDSIERVMGVYPQLPTIRPIVHSVVAGSPADRAGIQSGDHIAQINGESIGEWRELIRIVSESNGETLTVQYRRDKALHNATLNAEPHRVEERTIWRVGILIDVEEQWQNSDLVVKVRLGPVEAILRGIETTWSIITLTTRLLIDLLRFEGSADAIGGPIAIAEHAGQAAQAGLNNYLSFLALLSITLGILNLLPIPVLDGGHLMFHLYEAIVGSPPTERMLIWANQIGFALLLGIMGFAFYNDLSRIF